MPSEDELPNEIKKLKITPMESNAIKTQTSLNPFYDDNNVLGQTDTQLEENTTHTKCRRCRLRRRSESVVDDYKTGVGGGDYCGAIDVTAPSQHFARLCKHNTLNKHNLKRTIISTSGDRKIYMREPMLRALQRFCTHKQIRRKLQSPQEQEIKVINNNNNNNNKSQEEQEKCTDKFPSRGMSDFRDLIEECQSMLKQYQDADSNSDKLPEHSNRMEQFQCHRTIANDNPLELPSLHNISISEAQQQNVVVPTAARSSVSCSQQAGNSNVPCDDVTIDELASYFDTLVHIPKKMSTMAEMMYI